MLIAEFIPLQKKFVNVGTLTAIVYTIFSIFKYLVINDKFNNKFYY